MRSRNVDGHVTRPGFPSRRWLRSVSGRKWSGHGQMSASSHRWLDPLFRAIISADLFQYVLIHAASPYWHPESYGSLTGYRNADRREGTDAYARAGIRHLDGCLRRYRAVMPGPPTCYPSETDGPVRRLLHRAGRHACGLRRADVKYRHRRSSMYRLWSLTSIHIFGCIKRRPVSPPGGGIESKFKHGREPALDAGDAPRRKSYA